MLINPANSHFSPEPAITQLKLITRLQNLKKFKTQKGFKYKYILQRTAATHPNEPESNNTWE